MGVSTVPGHPDYETSTGTAQNIPWIFSKKTIVKFYDASVIPAISNTDYEGEIKKFGSKVIIRTVSDVSISDYNKGQLVTFEDLESPSVELDIDKAKSFAFKMDKIDIKQFDIDMMSKNAQDAAEQMAVTIDTAFLAATYSDAASANKGTAAGRKSASINLGTTGSPIQLTKANVLDKIIDCQVVAQEQNWPISDRWMVIPPWMSGLIMKSDLKDASLAGDDTSILRHGRLGMIGQWTLYLSNLYTEVTDTGNQCYNLMFGHKSAITFASQLVETEYFPKLESTFGSGMKGLNVHGYKTVKGEALGILYARQ